MEPWERLGQTPECWRLELFKLLLVLGILALSLVLYAGFLWMTSAGNEEKIDKAKGILKNAVIGLIIIMSSWGIVTFIIYKLDKPPGLWRQLFP